MHTWLLCFFLTRLAAGPSSTPPPDTPEDAKVAVANGAQGIGLCRTEHMFFASAQRIAAMRRMIAAVELRSPKADEALAELQKYQTEVRGVGGQARRGRGFISGSWVF